MERGTLLTRTGTATCARFLFLIASVFYPVIRRLNGGGDELRSKVMSSTKAARYVRMDGGGDDFTEGTCGAGNVHTTCASHSVTCFDLLPARPFVFLIVPGFMFSDL